MSLHVLRQRFLLQAEDDRNFVVTAITPTWVITDVNTEVTDLGNLAGWLVYVVFGGTPLPLVFFAKISIFSYLLYIVGCKVFIPDTLSVKYSL